MAEIVGGLVVSETLDGGVLHMANECEHGGYMEDLDGKLGQRVQLGLA